MNERMRCRFTGCVGMVVAVSSWLAINSHAHAEPIFSYTVGQSFPAPSDGDPGSYSPFGFSNVVGNYAAYTSGSYFNGTTWQTVPDGGYEATVVASSEWYPVAPLPGDTATWAMAINSLGHMIGNSTTSTANDWINIWQNSPGTDHAIYFAIGGATIPLQTLNGTSGLPMAINDLDQIVGESYTSQGVIHGFLTMPGMTAVDLNSLIQQGSGYTIQAGISINDQGQIQVIALGSDGMEHILTLSPNIPIDAIFGQPTDSSPNNIPEPAAIFPLAAAAVYTVAKRRRARARSLRHCSRLA